MDKRAKLRYENISYFEKDLVRICTEESRCYGGVYSSYNIDRLHNVLVVTMNIKSEVKQFFITFERLRYYMAKNKGNKEPVKLDYDNKKYTDSNLLDIGKQMAAAWGGVCVNYSINRKLERVIFNCMDTSGEGDSFQTDLAFYDLKKY